MLEGDKFDMMASRATRDQRNLNPHAEAILAMTMWGREYANQNGGSMDFWDGLDDSRKRICADVVKSIKETRGWDGGHCR